MTGVSVVETDELLPSKRHAWRRRERKESVRREGGERGDWSTSRDHGLDVIPVVREEDDDLGVVVDEVDGLGVGPDGLHEADGVRVDLLRLLRERRDSVRDGEPEPDEVSDLLEERDDLRIEVDDELVLVSRAPRLGDVEDASVDLHVPSLEVGEPGGEQRLGVELALKACALALELLTLGVELPSLPKHVLNALHVRRELTLDLLRPDDGSGDGREVSELRHVVGLRVAVIGRELLVETFNVLLDGLDELGLVLLDGSSDLEGSGEEGVSETVVARGWRDNDEPSAEREAC